jgi:hypothetical protein
MPDSQPVAIAQEKDELLRVEYVPLDLAMIWDDNKKKHSLPQLIASIERYGFKDLPKFEPRLNEGRGGIVEGNGRFEALGEMRRKSYPVPRGVQELDGQWLVPVLFGVDAASEAAAEAYGIDHNNLTLAGAVDVYSMLSLWQDGFSEQLQQLSEYDALPVSVTLADLDVARYWESPDELAPTLDELEDQYGDADASDVWPIIKVQVSPETHNLWKSLMRATGVENEADAMARVLGAVDTTSLAGPD